MRPHCRRSRYELRIPEPAVRRGSRSVRRRDRVVGHHVIDLSTLLDASKSQWRFNVGGCSDRAAHSARFSWRCDGKHGCARTPHRRRPRRERDSCLEIRRGAVDRHNVAALGVAALSWASRRSQEWAALPSGRGPASRKPAVPALPLRFSPSGAERLLAAPGRSPVAAHPPAGFGAGMEDVTCARGSTAATSRACRSTTM